MACVRKKGRLSFLVSPNPVLSAEVKTGQHLIKLIQTANSKRLIYNILRDKVN